MLTHPCPTKTPQRRPNTFAEHGQHCSYCGENIAHHEAFAFHNTYFGPWLYHLTCLEFAARADYLCDPKETGNA